MKFCAHCRRGFAADASFCPHDGGRLRRTTEERVAMVLDGQVRLDEIIGEGAMGVVFRGVQLGVQRPVAVKLMHPHMADDPGLVARFMREGRAAAKLSSPHLASAYLIGQTDDGVPYIVMELIEGETLEAMVGAIGIERAVEIGRQIAVALTEAHAAGVIHRDLKPANVMIARGRGGDRAVVLDFGVAKLLEDGPPLDGVPRGVRGDLDATRPALPLTREDAVFGTPSYFAPEQARGHAVASSDLYSLGVILYRLLTGRLPFEGNGMEVMVAHLTQPVPPLAAVLPSLDRELGNLVMRCLAKAPADRPGSAAELAGRLGAIGRRLAQVKVPRPRPRRSLLGALGGVLMMVGAAAALASGGDAAAMAHTLELERPAPRTADDLVPVPSAERRSLVLADDRLSLRVQLPEHIAAGEAAVVELDAWDAAEAPVDVAAIALVVIGPAGTTTAQARVTALAGRYRALLRFADPGRHTLAVQPPGGGPSIELDVEVAAAAR
jgi:serine/threonine-protein kinase